MDKHNYNSTTWLFSRVEIAWKGREFLCWEEDGRICLIVHRKCWVAGNEPSLTQLQATFWCLKCPSSTTASWTPAHKNTTIFAFLPLIRSDLLWQVPKSGVPESNWNFHSGKFHVFVPHSQGKDKKLNGATKRKVRANLPPPNPPSTQLTASNPSFLDAVSDYHKMWDKSEECWRISMLTGKL